MCHCTLVPRHYITTQTQQPPTRQNQLNAATSSAVVSNKGTNISVRQDRGLMEAARERLESARDVHP